LHFESYFTRIVERGAGIVIVDYNCKVGRSPAETGPGRKEGNDEKGARRPNARIRAELRLLRDGSESFVM